MFSRLFNTPLALYSIIAIVFYLILAVSIPTVVLIPLMNSLFIGTFVAVSIVFFPLMYRALRDNKFDRVTQMWSGITLVMVSLAVRITLSSYIITSGANANKFASSPIISFLSYIAIIGGVLHITAPHADDATQIGALPKKPIALGLGVGVLSAVISLVVQWQNGFPFSRN